MRPFISLRSSRLAYTLAMALAAEAFVATGALAQISNIGAARAAGAGTLVAFTNKAVTRSVGSRYYIEEPDRSAGIAVSLTRAYAPGTLVTVSGTLASIAGELVVSPAVDVVIGEGAPLIPLGITNQSAAGNELTEGLLVRVWGRVIATGFGSAFRIDDGSEVLDAVDTPGLRVYKGLNNVNVVAGDYVLVVGPRGMISGSIGSLPVIYLGSAGDLVKLN